MNMTPFFLARRILFASEYQKSISTMTIICFLGIFIASFALALTTAIMNGFEQSIHTTMQGIHSDIIIDTSSISVEMNILSSIFAREFPEIKAFSPTASYHILVRNIDKTHNNPTVAILKGIDPIQEQYTSAIAKKIISTTPDKEANNFPALLNDATVLIGKQLSQTYSLTPGDTIELLYIRDEEIRGKKVVFDAHKAGVSGIFATGIDEYDSSVIYSSLDFLESLYPNTTIDQINITVASSYDHTTLIEKLQKRLGLPVYSWKDLYPSLVVSLKLEKYVSFFIIALILLVASMNSMSLLFMHITHKRPEIALLKALGMKQGMVNAIFFILSMMISSLASITGLLFATVVGYLLQQYPLIVLPDIYYVTHLPVAMNATIVMVVFCLVVVLSILATIIPIKRLTTITIAQVLRFER